MSNKVPCKCTICGDKSDIYVDTFLLSEIECENTVIFGGAGVSTETRGAAPHSLYRELAHFINQPNTTEPFPDLAQKVAETPDGYFELLKTIQTRFDSINRMHDTRYEATKFYRELATMPYFKEFITTNWDRYFEDHCHAKPFVYDADMRFWHIPFRKVLKIHGTIDDYSSVIATVVSRRWWKFDGGVISG